MQLIGANPRAVMAGEGAPSTSGLPAPVVQAISPTKAPSAGGTVMLQVQHDNGIISAPFVFTRLPQ